MDCYPNNLLAANWTLFDNKGGEQEQGKKVNRALWGEKSQIQFRFFCIHVALVKYIFG